MPKYLVTCDLDDTLLTSKKKITKKTIRFIKKFVKDGNYFVLCTGRPLMGAINFWQQLSENGIHMPIITSNGGAVYFPPEFNAENIYNRIDLKLFKEFMSEIQPFIVCAEMRVDNRVYIENLKEVPTWITHFSLDTIIIEGKFSEIITEGPIISNIWIKEEYFEQFNEIANKYKDQMFIYNWGHYDNRYSFEILDINTSKGTMMNRLCKMLKCDFTIAFGDQANDISMISMANYGVAMINAKDTVKDAAKYITKKDHNHNGVIDFLKNMSKNEYKSFSYYYDEIMELIEYDGWVNLTKKYLNPTSKILDLACGSGTLAISLANDGYQVSGLDLSKEIIAVAKEKMITNHVEIDFSVKDMTNFSYNEKFDVITCYFDSVNFLTHDEVKLMMNSVYNNLNDGGYFIFDLFTLSKMKAFNNLTIKDNLAFAKYKWKMSVKNNTIYHKIKITDGTSKIVEKYHEYYHDVNEIIDSRFNVVSITTDFKDTFSEDDERILVVLQK